MTSNETKILVIADYLGRTNVHPIRPEAAQLFGAQQTGEFDITVMCSPESVMADYYRENGLRIIPHKIEEKLSLKSIRFIRATIRKHDFNILHLLNSRAISNGATAAIGLPIKVIAYRGQTGSISRFDPLSYLNVLHPRIDKIVCVAKSVEEDLRQHIWGNRNKLITIYKGHDPDWYQLPPADLSSLNLPDDAFILSLVANLRPRKGLSVLMAATHLLPPEAPIHILLVGGDPEDAQLQEMISSAAQPEKIHPLGYREDAPQVAGASSAVVLPTTKREGLSRSILEAMAYGRPAIVSDTGGNAELVADGISGHVVPPNDAKALADAIKHLSSDQLLCERYGAEAKNRLNTLFNAQQGVEKTIEIYRELAA